MPDLRRHMPCNIARLAWGDALPGLTRGWPQDWCLAGGDACLATSHAWPEATPALQRRTPGLYIIYTLYCDNFIKKCKRERWKLHTFSLNNHCNFNYFVDIKICLIRLKCTILICYIVKMLPIDYNVLKCFFFIFPRFAL